MASALARTLVWLRFVVVPAWVVAAIAATALPGLGQDASLAALEPSNSRALATELRSSQHFDVPLITRAAVVQRDPRGLSADAQRRVVERAATLAQQPDPQLGSLAGVIPLINVAGLGSAQGERSTTAISYLLFTPDTSLAKQDATARSFAERHIDQPDDALVGVTGASPGRVAQWDAISDALPLVTAATIVLIALVVGLHFRSIVAPLLALATAAVAYVVAVHLVGWLGERADLAVPQEVEPVMVVLLLGIVTDYAIFFLSGMRQRLGEGDDRLAAARTSARANIPIVFTAGAIVALGAGALVVGRTDFFRAFGPGLALSAAVATIVSITFLPAALALLGRVAFWPARPSAAAAAREPRRWRKRLMHLATARPAAIVITLVCVAALGLAASGLSQLRLGFPITGDLPSSDPVAHAEAAAQRGFAAGVLQPTEVLVEGAGVGDRAAELARLQRLLEQRHDVAFVLGPGQAAPRELPGAFVARDGGAARFAIVLGVAPLGHEALDAVAALRRDVGQLAREAGLGDVRADVAGDTALAEETIATMRGDLGLIVLAVIAVNLVVLALFLRSLRAPLYLVAASMLALAASLGLTTLVFQNTLDFGELAYFIPFASAVLLAALGSDYNVFVVGRVWREARRRPMREAVAVAAPRAARAISVAGLTLAASFAILALIPLRSFRELAFAMSVGVLIETFLVRSLLVPALIALFRPAEDDDVQPEPDAGEPAVLAQR